MTLMHANSYCWHLHRQPSSPVLMTTGVYFENILNMHGNKVRHQEKQFRDCMLILYGYLISGSGVWGINTLKHKGKPVGTYGGR